MTTNPEQIVNAERDVEAGPLLAAALDYAAHGWPVLPLRPQDKMPNGLLVPHGLHDATTDAARITDWWRREPNANVGIRTGDGLDVIDLDSAAAERAFYDSLPQEVTPDLIVRTARGWHLWFASSGLPTRAGVIEGVDVRGVGGYVVAPPSIHPNGATYRLVDPTTGGILDRLPDGALSPAPRWLVAWCRPETVRTAAETAPIRLNAHHYVRAAIDRECAAVATTPEGKRNDRLNRAAFSLGTLVGAHVLDMETARTHLLGAAAAAGLEEREARRTIASGLDAGERQPRSGAVLPASLEPSASCDRSRSANPPVRPADPASAAVLDRARSGAPSAPPVTAPIRPAPQQGISR